MSYRSINDHFAGWQAEVFSGKPPIRWAAGAGELGRLELGPGLIALLGGRPGGGKTALACQVVVDAVRATPDLRALVVNVEMSPGLLLDRQLARLSGVDLTTIRGRLFDDDHRDRLAYGIAELQTVGNRLAFLDGPYGLDNIAAAVDDFGADLLCLDYVQRIEVPGKHASKRESINALMDTLRQFADAGIGILAIAALGRSKNKAGQSSYETVGLASFRESAELEYGCDSGWLLLPMSGDDVALKCVKNRHGEVVDVPLTFDRDHQTFRAAMVADDRQSTIPAELRRLWATTPGYGGEV